MKNLWQPISTVRNRGFKWLLAGVWLGFSGYLYVHDPRTEPFLPQCLILRFTGRECPSCGITRAYYHFLHGDLIASIHANALPYLLFAIFALATYISPKLRAYKRWSMVMAVGALFYVGMIAIIG